MLMLPLQATLGRTMNITEGMLKREKVNEVLPQILDWKSRDSNTIEADAHTSRITARRDEWESFHIKINTKVSFLLFFFFLHLSSCLIWRGTVENPNIYICLFSPLKQTLSFMQIHYDWFVRTWAPSTHFSFNVFHAPHTAHMPGLVGWFTSPTYKKK